MLTELLLALSLASPTAAPSPAPSAPPAFTAGGVTLGETATQLVADHGEPLLAQAAGTVQLWMYFSPGGGSLESIAVRGGRVTGAGFIGHKTGPPAEGDNISALGVHLGDPLSSVPPAGQSAATMTVAGVKYTFRSGKGSSTVDAITAALTDDSIAALPPAASMPVLHDGSSIAEAVLIRAATPQLAPILEGGFMAGHDFCNPGGKWKLISRTPQQSGTRTYDVLQAGCSNNSITKSMYFDVQIKAKTAGE